VWPKGTPLCSCLSVSVRRPPFPCSDWLAETRSFPCILVPLEKCQGGNAHSNRTAPAFFAFCAVRPSRFFLTDELVSLPEPAWSPARTDHAFPYSSGLDSPEIDTTFAGSFLQASLVSGVYRSGFMSGEDHYNLDDSDFSLLSLRTCSVRPFFLANVGAAATPETPSPIFL